MNIKILPADILTRKDFCLPAEDELQICIAPIIQEPAINLLPENEQQRAQALRSETERKRYLTARLLLRHILSVYFDRPPASFSFLTGPHGKPALANPETQPHANSSLANADCLQRKKNASDNPETQPHANSSLTNADCLQHKKNASDNPEARLQFNLSHSGDYIALAFSVSSPVGIDIEKIRTNLRADSLVARFFHPDEAAIFSKLDANEKQAFLFRRWTIREAFLKGIGSGLSVNPASFCVEQMETSSGQSLCGDSLKEGSAWRITKSDLPDASLWRIRSIPAPEDYFCSAAFRNTTV